ncbi:MAG: Hpt domain-containing protein [Clostridia bacterium]|nr:Hpt domain-containing protein [Clostridia bacterium]
MLTIENLKEYGAEVEKALQRCGNNEALYLRLVGICINELLEDKLGIALKEGEIDRAFDIAHKIKGGVCNLALNPISEPICELTELLRNKTPGEYEKLHARIVLKTNELAELMK